MIWKGLFNTKTPTWQAFGRVVFVESDDGATALRLAKAAAEAAYPSAEISLEIQPSTEQARAVFLARKAAHAQWVENTKHGRVNHREDLNVKPQPDPLASPGVIPEVDKFIPHGSRCEADDGRGSDFGKCQQPATHIVSHEGHDRYVCRFHFEHYTPERRTED